MDRISRIYLFWNVASLKRWCKIEPWIFLQIKKADYYINNIYIYCKHDIVYIFSFIFVFTYNNKKMMYTETVIIGSVVLFTVYLLWERKALCFFLKR